MAVHFLHVSNHIILSGGTAVALREIAKEGGLWE